MSLAIVIGIIFSILIIFLFSYWMYLMFYKPEDRPSHDLIIWNRHLSHLTSGYKEGIGKVSKGMIRDLVIFTPRDLDWLKHYSDGRYKEFQPPTLKLWIPREKLNYFHSDERNFVEIFPLSIEDIDKEFTKSAEGKILMQKISDQNAELTEKDFTRSELEKVRALINENLVGESTVKVIDSKLMEMAEKLKEEKLKKE